MTQRGKGKELFEILGDSPSSPVPPAAVEKMESTEPVVPIPSPGRTTPTVPTSAGKPVVSIKQETCVFGAIVLILVVIFAFTLGYYKGRRDGFPRKPSGGTPAKVSGSAVAPAAGASKRTPPEKSPVPPMRGTIPAGRTRTTPKSIVTPRAIPRKKVTLRVWTGSRSATNSARQIVASFKSKGLNAWTSTDHEGIKIFVGRFQSKSDPEAVMTRNQVRELIYKGSRPFQDCYFVRAED